MNEFLMNGVMESVLLAPGQGSKPGNQGFAKHLQKAHSCETLVPSMGKGSE